MNISLKVKTELIKTDVFPRKILEIFPMKIRSILANIPVEIIDNVEEIRIRINRPLLLVTNNGHITLSKENKISRDLLEGYLITKEDIEKILHKISQSSIYAWEEEFKRGYLTLQGGHRVGMTGKVLLDKGLIRTMKEISSLNIRIAKQIIGVADCILPYIIDPKYGIRHTLIVSPPQCGKTTLLRDIVRQLSDGIPKLNFSGINVGLVDERSELAGMYEGVPQFNIGLRTDVLDGCPKAQGMIMLIRSMSPQVIATDEIGTSEDIQAIEEVLNAGISLVTTVHARNVNELSYRPYLKDLIEKKFFSRLIILGRSKGVGTIEKVLDGKTFKILNSKPLGGRVIKN